MSDLGPPSGVKRKSDFGTVRAAFDPKRTSQRLIDARCKFALHPVTSSAWLCSSEGGSQSVDKQVIDETPHIHHTSHRYRCGMAVRFACATTQSDATELVCFGTQPTPRRKRNIWVP